MVEVEGFIAKSNFIMTLTHKKFPHRRNLWFISFTLISVMTVLFFLLSGCCCVGIIVHLCFQLTQVYFLVIFSCTASIAKCDLMFSIWSPATTCSTFPACHLPTTPDPDASSLHPPLLPPTERGCFVSSMSCLYHTLLHQFSLEWSLLIMHSEVSHPPSVFTARQKRRHEQTNRTGGW